MGGLIYLMARTPLFMSRRVVSLRFGPALSTRTAGKYLLYLKVILPTFRISYDFSTKGALLAQTGAL